MTNEELERALTRLAVATYNELVMLRAKAATMDEARGWSKTLIEGELRAFQTRFMTGSGAADLPGFEEEMQRQRLLPEDE